MNGFVSDWNVFSSNGASSGDVDAGAAIDNDSGLEGAIRFSNLTGGAIGSATETRIDDTTISGALFNGVSIADSGGTLTQLDVHHTTSGGSRTGSGMRVSLSGGSVSIDVQNSTLQHQQRVWFRGRCKRGYDSFSQRHRQHNQHQYQ